MAKELFGTRSIPALFEKEEESGNGRVLLLGNNTELLYMRIKLFSYRGVLYSQLNI